jgi:hypothetical protein
LVRSQTVAAGTMMRKGIAKPWLERYVEPARCTRRLPIITQ